MLPTSSDDWNAALAPTVAWDKAYQFVADRVEHLFVKLGNPRRFTTAELVEFFYPADRTRGAGITARRRIFSALAALADHQLKDYWEPGEPRPLKHNKAKQVTPKIWRTPAPKENVRVELRSAIEAFDLAVRIECQGGPVAPVTAAWERIEELLEKVDG